MPPHADFLRYIVPVLILLPVLYFRLRRMMKPQALKLNRLWVRPVIYVVLGAVMVFAPLPAPPGVAVPHLAGPDFAWLALAVVLGAMAGWQWGRTTRLHLHPENGTLMSSGGAAGMVVFLMLIVLKLGLRAGAAGVHVNTVLMTDVSILFSALLFSVRGLEIWLRARRILEQKAA